MTRFIYLVQGQANLVRTYLHLEDRENADAIFLTYDEPISEAIFFPNSTWAEGRNRLLEHALLKGRYDYYVFCDDDISFTAGGWSDFESRLTELRPSIGVPIVPATSIRKRSLRLLRYQLFRSNDQQLMAFHHDVVMDGIVLPYQTRFDDIHWWASCQIQEILTQNFYHKHAIQFNNIEISNDCSIRYPNTDQGRKEFETHVHKWLSKQFRNKYRVPSCSRTALPLILFRTLLLMLFRCVSDCERCHSVKQGDCKEQLSNNSELLRQYLEHVTRHLSRQ